MPEHYFYEKGVSLKDFKRQLLFYKKHYNVISLQQAHEMLSNRQSLENCLTITTDDGVYFSKICSKGTIVERFGDIESLVGILYVELTGKGGPNLLGSVVNAIHRLN